MTELHRTPQMTRRQFNDVWNGLRTVYTSVSDREEMVRVPDGEAIWRVRGVDSLETLEKVVTATYGVRAVCESVEWVDGDSGIAEIHLVETD